MIARILVLLLVTPTAWAEQAIYRSTGDQGETRFSDVQAAGAVEIAVYASTVPKSQARLVRERHAEILAAAEDLAAARRARDLARIERSARARVAAEQAVEPEPRAYPVAVLYPRYPWYHRPHSPHRGPQRMPDRRPFEPVFRPIPPAFGQ